MLGSIQVISKSRDPWAGLVGVGRAEVHAVRGAIGVRVRLGLPASATQGCRLAGVVRTLVQAVGSACGGQAARANSTTRNKKGGESCAHLSMNV
eukprot:13706976-Alexandrium_andersonii.AAC.1